MSLNEETDVASAPAELTEQSLRPGAQEMKGQVEIWSSRVNGGLWLKVHAAGVQIANELLLTGLAPNPDRVGKLSNRQWPGKHCDANCLFFQSPRSMSAPGMYVPMPKHHRPRPFFERPARGLRSMA